MHFPKWHTLGCEETVQNCTRLLTLVCPKGRNRDDGSSPNQTGNKTLHFKSLKKKISKFNGWSWKNSPRWGLSGKTREVALIQFFPHDEGGAGEAWHLREKLSSVNLLVEEGQKANDVSLYKRSHGTKVAN